MLDSTEDSNPNRHEKARKRYENAKAELFFLYKDYNGVRMKYATVFTLHPIMGTTTPYCRSLGKSL
jgi:hypothetical protein